MLRGLATADGSLPSRLDIDAVQFDRQVGAEVPASRRRDAQGALARSPHQPTRRQERLEECGSEYARHVMLLFGPVHAHAQNGATGGSRGQRVNVDAHRGENARGLRTQGVRVACERLGRSVARSAAGVIDPVVSGEHPGIEQRARNPDPQSSGQMVVA